MGGGFKEEVYPLTGISSALPLLEPMAWLRGYGLILQCHALNVNRIMRENIKISVF
jgi:hypothetical protein